jgi:hypothetical protein
MSNNEPKFTPGPWWFSEASNGNYDIGQGDYALATTVPMWNGLGYSERQEGQDVANARLIAAAPELLAACEALIASKCSGCAGEGTRYGDVMDNDGIETLQETTCGTCGGSGVDIEDTLLLVRVAIAKAKGESK